MKLSKKVLEINLKNREYDFKIYKGSESIVGGMGLALELLLENKDKNPAIFTCGPLSGLFPYTSKACLLFLDENRKLQEYYGGGSFAAKLRLLGIDGLILYNAGNETNILISKNSVFFKDALNKKNIDTLGISGIKSTICINKNLIIDNYFTFGNVSVDKHEVFSKLRSITLSGEGEIEIPNPRDYKEVYNHILGRKNEVLTKYSTNPSCFGCPVGCGESKEGEAENPAILPKCLIACQSAEEIYKDIPLVFSCLTVLGLKYNHEDLENLPNVVSGLIKNLSDICK